MTKTEAHEDIVEAAERELAQATDAHAAARTALDTLSDQLRDGKTVKPDVFALASHEEERTKLIRDGCQQRLETAHNSARLQRLTRAAEDLRTAFAHRESDLQDALTTLLSAVDQVETICNQRRRALSQAVLVVRREKVPARENLRGSHENAASPADAGMTWTRASSFIRSDRVFVNGTEYSLPKEPQVLIAQAIRAKLGRLWLQQLAS